MMHHHMSNEAVKHREGKINTQAICNPDFYDLAWSNQRSVGHVNPLQYKRERLATHLKVSPSLSV